MLNGGEVAAIALVEGISRLLPGMMGNPQSLLEESHCAAGLLEYPSYTRPQVFRGIAVPEVLTSGNHGAIARWRKDRAIERTAAIRPDLMRALEPSALDKTDREKLGELRWFSSTENPKLRRVRFRQAVPADALELSEFAARTWPDACPPTMSEQAIADYIANNLNSEVFSQYLCNPKENLIYLAELSSADEEYETDWRQNTDETPCAGQIVAYLLVHLPRERDGVAGQEAGAPVNFQYDGQLREGPLVYLSKAYVARTWRGSGVFAAFAKWALAQVRAELAQYRNPFIWLGTQIDNRRAQRAYRRIGFQRSGKREFRVGDEVNIDVTMARPLNMAK